MTGGFNVNAQTQRLRAENTKLRKENEDLRAGLNLDKYQKKCEEQAEKRNEALIKENRGLQAQANKQTRTIEKLEASIEALRPERARAAELEKQLKEANTDIERLEKETERLKSENLSLEEKLGEAQKLQEKTAQENEQLRKQVVSLGGRVEELENHAKTDFHNSSQPSSKTPNHKAIPNGRTPSGKGVGGQKGHKHHERKTGLPSGGTCTVLGDDDPLWDDPDYVFDGYHIKHVVGPVMMVYDQVYFVPVFRNRHTGAHKSIHIPAEMKDEVNPSAELKAMALYLSLYANVGVSKTSDIIGGFTGGQLRPCPAFINGLSVEFAEKSEQERAGTYAKLLHVHALHVDGTTIKVGGRQYNVTICVAGNRTLYFFRPRKGYAGVKGTPIEHTTAILIHDHAIEYYSYGSGHQECLEHVKRYLMRSVQVETDLTWNTKMLEFVKKLMGEAKAADQERASRCVTAEENAPLELESTTPRARFSQEMIDQYRDEFMRITELGLKEYKDTPPKKWFKDGQNLCERLHENPDAYLLFMEDDGVDYTNNPAEQRARLVKRKIASCMEFRGFLNVIAYCEGLSVIEMLRADDSSVVEALADIFRREETIADKVRLNEEYLTVLGGVEESDENILEKDRKKLAQTQEEKAGVVVQMAGVQQEYEKARNGRIARSGQDSEPDEEEAGLKRRYEGLAHREYTLTLAERSIEKDIKFDEVHLASVKEQTRRVKDLIEKLKKRLQKEEAATEEDKKAPSPSPLPDVDPESLAAAMEKAEAARKEFERAQKELLLSYGAQMEVIKPLGYGASREPDAATKAEESIKMAQGKLREATDAYSEAKKELDRVRKGVKRSTEKSSPESAA